MFYLMRSALVIFNKLEFAKRVVSDSESIGWVFLETRDIRVWDKKQNSGDTQKKLKRTVWHVQW